MADFAHVRPEYVIVVPRRKGQYCPQKVCSLHPPVQESATVQLTLERSEVGLAHPDWIANS